MKVIEAVQTYYDVKSVLYDTNIKLDIGLKFKLLGILKAFEIEKSNYDFIRNEKIAEYGTENENGEISISKDDIEARTKFLKDMEILNNTECNIQFTKIKAKEILENYDTDVALKLFNIMEE